MTGKEHDAPVAQLDRASGYEPEGRELESLRTHEPASISSDKLFPGGSVSRISNWLWEAVATPSIHKTWNFGVVFDPHRPYQPSF